MINTWNLETFESFKYFGFVFDPYMSSDVGVGLLAESAGRALGEIIDKYKHLKDVGYNVFTQINIGS